MLVSAVQQHDSAVCIHISPPSYSSLPLLWYLVLWRHSMNVSFSYENPYVSISCVTSLWIPLPILSPRSVPNLSLALAQKESYWEAPPWVEKESFWMSKRSSVLSSCERSPRGTSRASFSPFPFPFLSLQGHLPWYSSSFSHPSLSLFLSAGRSPCGEDTQLTAVPKRWVNTERGWCENSLSNRFS